jgi:hypothetical protein
VSRIIDDEKGDTWERVDIAADELQPQAAWVRASREAIGTLYSPCTCLTRPPFQ